MKRGRPEAYLCPNCGVHYLTPYGARLVATLAKAPPGGWSMYELAEKTSLSVRTVRRCFARIPGLLTRTQPRGGREAFWSLSARGKVIASWAVAAAERDAK